MQRQAINISGAGAQVEAACALPWMEEIILDFLEVHGLRAACEAVRAAGKRCVVRAAACMTLP